MAQASPEFSLIGVPSQQAISPGACANPVTLTLEELASISATTDFPGASSLFTSSSLLLLGWPQLDALAMWDTIEPASLIARPVPAEEGAQAMLLAIQRLALIDISQSSILNDFPCIPRQRRSKQQTVRVFY